MGNGGTCGLVGILPSPCAAAHIPGPKSMNDE